MRKKALIDILRNQNESIIAQNNTLLIRTYEQETVNEELSIENTVLKAGVQLREDTILRLRETIRNLSDKIENNENDMRELSQSNESLQQQNAELKTRVTVQGNQWADSIKQETLLLEEIVKLQKQLEEAKDEQGTQVIFEGAVNFYIDINGD